MEEKIHYQTLEATYSGQGYIDRAFSHLGKPKVSGRETRGDATKRKLEVLTNSVIPWLRDNFVKAVEFKRRIYKILAGQYIDVNNQGHQVGPFSPDLLKPSFDTVFFRGENEKSCAHINLNLEQELGSLRGFATYLLAGEIERDFEVVREDEIGNLDIPAICPTDSLRDVEVRERFRRLLDIVKEKGDRMRESLSEADSRAGYLIRKFLEQSGFEQLKVDGDYIPSGVLLSVRNPDVEFPIKTKSVLVRAKSTANYKNLMKDMIGTLGERCEAEGLEVQVKNSP